MKLRKYISVAILSIFAITQSGCLGQFALTKKVLAFNMGIDNNGIISHLLFWIVGGPVYSATVTIDVLFLNFLEFWSGTNPIAMGEGESESQIIEKDGVIAKITVTKNKMLIEAVNVEAESVEIDFDPENDAASINTANSSTYVTGLNAKMDY